MKKLENRLIINNDTNLSYLECLVKVYEFLENPKIIKKFEDMTDCIPITWKKYVCIYKKLKSGTRTFTFLYR